MPGGFIILSRLLLELELLLELVDLPDELVDLAVGTLDVVPEAALKLVDLDPEGSVLLLEFLGEDLGLSGFVAEPLDFVVLLLD